MLERTSPQILARPSARDVPAQHTQGIRPKQLCAVLCELQVTAWAPRSSVPLPPLSIVSEPAAVLSLCFLRQKKKAVFHRGREMLPARAPVPPTGSH